jgi:ribosomal protein L24
MINSKFIKGSKVIISTGRFAGFTGKVVDHFAATNKETKMIEFGVVVKNKAGEKKQAFDSRILAI